MIGAYGRTVGFFPCKNNPRVPTVASGDCLPAGIKSSCSERRYVKRIQSVISRRMLFVHSAFSTRTGIIRACWCSICTKDGWETIVERCPFVRVAYWSAFVTPLHTLHERSLPQHRRIEPYYTWNLICSMKEALSYSTSIILLIYLPTNIIFQELFLE